jgi:predicted nucleotidyltransferase
MKKGELNIKKKKTLKEIKDILYNIKDFLHEKYGVKNIAIFGSYIRGEQKKTSDIDILVEFDKPIGFSFIELANYLSDLLGIDVDLITPSMLSKNPFLKKEIEKELYYV